MATACSRVEGGFADRANSLQSTLTATSGMLNERADALNATLAARQADLAACSIRGSNALVDAIESRGRALAEDLQGRTIGLVERLPGADAGSRDARGQSQSRTSNAAASSTRCSSEPAPSGRPRCAHPDILRGARRALDVPERRRASTSSKVARSPSQAGSTSRSSSLLDGLETRAAAFAATLDEKSRLLLEGVASRSGAARRELAAALDPRRSRPQWSSAELASQASPGLPAILARRLDSGPPLCRGSTEEPRAPGGRRQPLQGHLRERRDQRPRASRRSRSAPRAAGGAARDAGPQRRRGDRPPGRGIDRRARRQRAAAARHARHADARHHGGDDRHQRPGAHRAAGHGVAAGGHEPGAAGRARQYGDPARHARDRPSPARSARCARHSTLRRATPASRTRSSPTRSRRCATSRPTSCATSPPWRSSSRRRRRRLPADHVALPSTNDDMQAGLTERREALEAIAAGLVPAGRVGGEPLDPPDYAAVRDARHGRGADDHGRQHRARPHRGDDAAGERRADRRR